MNLEELNKTQIILLTLLTSFVTSIATGIVTVSLMAQAPQGITQTINRIVERTVEKVTPDTSGKTAQTTTEKTVVVKEDDVVADSVSKAHGAIVKIVAKGDEDTAFFARGVIVDSKGVVVTSRNIIDSTVPSEVLLSNGVRVPFAVRKTDSASIAVLDLDLKLATTTNLTSIPLADLSKARLGQTVLLLSGKGRDSLGQGVIGALPSGGEGRGAYVEATAEGAVPGGIIINIFGDIVGMVTVDSLAVDSGLYTPSSVLADALKTPTAPSGHSAP